MYDLPMKYLRMQRHNIFEEPEIDQGIDLSGSWITYELPQPMTSTEAEEWITKYMPGWELIMASMTNPDID